MLFPDNDRAHFHHNYCGYMHLFYKFDNEIKTKYNAELSIRIRDSVHNDCIVLNLVEAETKRILNPSGSLKELFDEFEIEFRNSCSNCGQTPADYISTSHSNNYELDQLKLCLECSHSFRKETDILTSATNMYFNRHLGRGYKDKEKRIRFIDPINRMEFVEFGKYFFVGKELYIISNRLEYAKFDVKSDLRAKNRRFYVPKNHFVVNVSYAGQQTGFYCSQGSEIYTGDIVRARGTRKDIDLFIDCGGDETNAEKSNYDFIGVVCSEPNNYIQNSNEFPKKYQVSVERVGEPLDIESKYEILNTVFCIKKEVIDGDFYSVATCFLNDFNEYTGFSLGNIDKTIEVLKKI
jgi:hypothetical protein